MQWVDLFLLWTSNVYIAITTRIIHFVASHFVKDHRGSISHRWVKVVPASDHRTSWAGVSLKALRNLRSALARFALQTSPTRDGKLDGKGGRKWQGRGGSKGEWEHRGAIEPRTKNNHWTFSTRITQSYPVMTCPICMDMIDNPFWIQVAYAQ